MPVQRRSSDDADREIAEILVGVSGKLREVRETVDQLTDLVRQHEPEDEKGGERDVRPIEQDGVVIENDDHP